MIVSQASQRQSLFHVGFWWEDTGIWEREYQKGTEIKYNNYAFIDGENLYKSIRQQGWKLDYYKFRKYLSDKYNITKALIFIGYVNWNKALYNYLRKAGFELVFKQTITKPNGEPKGNVDAELVLRVMLETENFDKAIIVTCDGDYSCLGACPRIRI